MNKLASWAKKLRLKELGYNILVCCGSFFIIAHYLQPFISDRPLFSGPDGLLLMSVICGLIQTYIHSRDFTPAWQPKQTS